MGYRVYVWSSHNILGKEGAAYGGPNAKRHFTLSMVQPFLYDPPFRLKSMAIKELVKTKRYDEKNNPQFLFRYRIVKVKAPGK